MLNVFKEIVRDIYVRFTSDDGFALAGNMAFCMLLALFPFLIFLTSVAGVFGNEQLAATVVEYLLTVAPKELVEPLTGDVRRILTSTNPGLLTFSFCFTLYAAASGVESIRTGLNRAYGYVETRVWPVRFLQNVAFVVTGTAILLLLALLVVFVPVFWTKAQHLVSTFAGISGDWLQILRLPVSLGLLFVGLMLAHLFLPAKRHPVREIFPGIVITMLLWLTAASVFTDYLRHFARFHVMYAGLAHVIIALVFLYISGIILILGGTINQALINRLYRSSPSR